MSSRAYYAVNKGHKPGIYNTWRECEENVKGYRNAVFKKFKDVREAVRFVNEGHAVPVINPERLSEFSPMHATPKLEPVKRTPTEIPKTTLINSTHELLGKKRSYEETHNVEEKKEEAEGAKGDGTDADGHRTKRPAINSKKVTVVYTDGASSCNGQGNAQAGYGVYWGQNDPRNASVRLRDKRQTNQRAEAAAVIHALQQDIQGTNTLEIRTDSIYVIKAVTEWCKKWVTNGWKSSNGKDVMNRDLLERIIDLMKRRKGEVKFVHVRGHQGIEGNEMADKLAVAGAQKSL